MIELRKYTIWNDERWHIPIPRRFGSNQVLGFGRKAQLIYPETAVEDFKAYLNTVMGLYESC